MAGSPPSHGEDQRWAATCRQVLSRDQTPERLGKAPVVMSVVGRGVPPFEAPGTDRHLSILASPVSPW